MLKRLLYVSIFYAFCTSVAFAGFGQGRVTQIIVRASDGLVYFFLNAPPTDRPSCATQPYWMIKDENSEVGKRQLALLMEAQATGREVQVQGFGTCTRWVDGEDVNVVILTTPN